MTIIFILSIVFVIAVVVFNYCAIKRGPLSEVISKGIASVLFVTIGCLAFPMSCDNGDMACTFQTGIIAGLVFGMIGDILLALRRFNKSKRNAFIMSGIAAFALGHLCFLAVIALNMVAILPDHLIWLGILPVLLGLLFGYGMIKLSPLLHLDFGKLRAGVFFYGALIACMLFTAILTAVVSTVQNGFVYFYMIPAIASLLFVTSDSLLSKSYFDKSGEINAAWLIIAIHAAYYAAQYLFAISAIGPQILG